MKGDQNSTVADRDPPANETADVASVGRIEEQEKNDNLDSASTMAATEAEADKAFATMRATLAMRGFELHALGDGQGDAAYVVRRWSMSCTLPDLPAVQAFAERAGVRT